MVTDLEVTVNLKTDESMKEASDLQKETDKVAKDWEQKKRKIVSEIKTTLIGIRQVVNVVKNVIVLTGNTIDPMMEATFEIINASVTVMLGAATAYLSFGPLGAGISIALSVAALTYQQIAKQQAAAGLAAASERFDAAAGMLSSLSSLGGLI